MVAEKCVKQVPYTVCKPVHYTKTIQVTRCVPKQVAYTVTRCCPKVVCKQVPVQVAARCLRTELCGRAELRLRRLSEVSDESVVFF